MLRLVSGLGAVSGFLVVQSRSFDLHRHLLPTPLRSVYTTSGFTTRAFNARRKMVEVISRVRLLLEVEVDPSEISTSIWKARAWISIRNALWRTLSLRLRWRRGNQRTRRINRSRERRKGKMNRLLRSYIRTAMCCGWTYATR